MPTSIGWTNEVWNPTTGCTKVSAGCKNCYAERIAQRFWRNENYRPFTEVRLHPERLDIPLHWRKPRMIFVDSMSDLFHEEVPDEFVDKVFGTMFSATWHTFQILTKRADRMQRYFTERWNQPPDLLLPQVDKTHPNVWLGASCEDQKAADERLPLLLQTPAAVRFVSAEPLLGMISFQGWDGTLQRNYLDPDFAGSRSKRGPLDWLICGGESGPNHRPMQLEWLESIVEQCQSAGVPVYVKQDSGLYPGQQGRIPDRLWIHEFPEAK
jgi:protein gp37